MHFYDFNIGEYAKKTAHLTNEEDIAYRRAIDMYYDTEKPLDTQNIPSLSRRLRVGIEALQNVINEFFPDGVNKHCEEKIAAYYAFVEKQKANGMKGGRPKRTQALATANPKKPKPKPLLPTTHLPLPTTKESLPKNQEMSKTEATAFAVPEWIDKDHWDLWVKSRKKMTNEQKGMQVKKLEGWKNEGLDYKAALFNAAANGTQGLFLPNNAKPKTANLQSDNDQVREAARKRLFGDLKNATE